MHLCMSAVYVQPATFLLESSESPRLIFGDFDAVGARPLNVVVLPYMYARRACCFARAADYRYTLPVGSRPNGG